MITCIELAASLLSDLTQHRTGGSLTPQAAPVDSKESFDVRNRSAGPVADEGWRPGGGAVIAATVPDQIGNRQSSATGRTGLTRKTPVGSRA
jgi:hypothetical protein